MEYIEFRYEPRKTKLYELFVIILSFLYFAYHFYFLYTDTKQFSKLATAGHGAYRFDPPMFGFIAFLMFVAFIITAATKIRGLSAFLLLIPIARIWVGTRYYMNPAVEYYYQSHPAKVILACSIIFIVCLASVFICIAYMNMKKSNMGLKTVAIISSVACLGLNIWAATFNAWNSDLESLLGCVLIGFEVGLIVGAYKRIEETKEKTEVETPQIDKSATSLDIAKTIKEYKELLDMGVITQEEFDIKKQELLNL